MSVYIGSVIDISVSVVVVSEPDPRYDQKGSPFDDLTNVSHNLKLLSLEQNQKGESGKWGRVEVCTAECLLIAEPCKACGVFC